MLPLFRETEDTWFLPKNLAVLSKAMKKDFLSENFLFFLNTLLRGLSPMASEHLQLLMEQLVKVVLFPFLSEQMRKS